MRALSRQKRIAIELILARHGGKPSSARPSAAGSTSSDCAGLPGEAANKLTGPAEALPDHVVVTTMWISHVAAATTWWATTAAARCQADNVCHYRLRRGLSSHTHRVGGALFVVVFGAAISVREECRLRRDQLSWGGPAQPGHGRRAR